MRDLSPQSENLNTCWTCGSTRMTLVKKGDLPVRISAEQFQITDSNYGKTGDIFGCEDCGFHQCSTMQDVLDFYVEMVDEIYEATRRERAVQERALLKNLARVKPGGRLLDVGAGSGILVEQAIGLGYDAMGVEPSRALQETAVSLNLPVKLGVLPHPELLGPFDVVTGIDVIEHVPDPVGLLKEIAAVMSNDGIAAVVTPDRKSVMARLMGWKWWHYRIAHVGYFDRYTMTRALDAAGLTVVHMRRPGWYFPGDYLFDRVMQYSPTAIRMKAPAFLRKISIPLNLRDSMMFICQKRRRNT